MIKITDKYAIDSDLHQWKISKHLPASEKKPERWEGIKFYESLPACTKALRDLLLRTSDYDSFAQLEKNAKAINRLIEKKLRGIPE